MRIASFNILHGQTVSSPQAHATAHEQSPSDGPPDAAALHAAIDELAPSVVALQEVDQNQPRSGHSHQTEAVAQALGADEYRFVPTVVGTPGGANGFRPTTPAERGEEVSGDPRYGVALISTLPVSAWHSKVFPPAPISLPLLVQREGKPSILKVRDEQRAAIAAQIETSYGPVTVATAHLSFVPGYNVRQLRQIRKWLELFPRPLFLIGDFNLPGKIPARVTRMAPMISEPTFPSYRPRIQCDHLLAEGLSPVGVVEVAQSARTWFLPVSDHLAVSVDWDPSHRG